MDEIIDMIQYAKEFGEPSMQKLNQMDIKEIFNFMDNFLLDQDISLHIGKEFLENATTCYEVTYNNNKELDTITLKKRDYDVLTLDLNILGIICYHQRGHGPRKAIIKLSWKSLKDIMFKD